MSASNAGRIGVWGRSGSGKSSYVKAQIAARKRVVIFDPLAEYGRLAGVQLIEHRSRDSLDHVRQAMRRKWASFRLSYAPPAGQECAALSALCRLLMAAQEPVRASGRGDMLTLVVEEMNMAFPVAGGAQKCPGFAEVCSRGRHYGIEVIGAAQRIAEVSTRFRGNCTESVVLAQKGPRDLAAAASELGIDRGRVADLSNLQFLREAGGKVTAGNITYKRNKPVVST